MKKIIGLLIIGGFLFPGCEEDPTIQAPGFQPQPVIYSIINTEDSIHYIRISRFFSGLVNPALTGQIADSIYFREAAVKVSIQPLSGPMVSVDAEPVIMSDKGPGFFNSDSFRIYRFEKKLIRVLNHTEILLFDSVFVEVTIPNLPVARCSTSLVWPPRIWSPFQAQQFVFIYPDNPMRVQWSGDNWNEVDVAFEIKEQFADSIKTRKFSIQKSNDVQINGKYYEIKVPYELVVEILNKNLEVRSDIVRRYFGTFRIDVLTGNKDFGNFMKFRNGINDFNFNPFFNVDNGIGMLSAKSSTIKTGLFLDQASRMKFANEPVLRKFRFTEY